MEVFLFGFDDRLDCILKSLFEMFLALYYFIYIYIYSYMEHRCIDIVRIDLVIKVSVGQYKVSKDFVIDG